MCRCGTLGHGLAGMVVLSWQFVLKSLEVFSNLNDSMINEWDCNVLRMDVHT